MGFWSGYGLGVLTCLVLATAALLLQFLSETRDALCGTCNKYFNSNTRALDCPHQRLKGKRWDRT